MRHHLRRPLRVSGRAVAEHWDVHPTTVQRAGEAGLLSPLPGVDGFDAVEALDLGRRPFVNPRDLDAFPPQSILFVQQSPRQWLEPGHDDEEWRTAYGWSSDMSPEDALLSACGWWPVDQARRPGVLGVVSAVASFVVTIGLVDREDPVADVRHNKVRFNITAATETTPVGRRMLRVFSDRRMAIRAGSSFLLPESGDQPSE